ncbi:MAG: hypothetical protein WBE72_10715 [Terracidiphilus sp.]
MPFVPAMWAVWVVLVLCFIVLKFYVSRLSRDEDDQLVLQESFERVRLEQAALVTRLNKIQPLQRAILWVLGAASVFVAVYYLHDMLSQFK